MLHITISFSYFFIELESSETSEHAVYMDQKCLLHTSAPQSKTVNCACKTSWLNNLFAVFSQLESGFELLTLEDPLSKLRHAAPIQKVHDFQQKQAELEGHLVAASVTLWRYFLIRLFKHQTFSEPNVLQYKGDTVDAEFALYLNQQELRRTIHFLKVPQSLSVTEEAQREGPPSSVSGSHTETSLFVDATDQTKRQ